MGVTFPAVAGMKQEMPRDVYLAWLLASDTVARQNRQHKDASAQLYRTFSENGFRSCILKGQAAGALYPDPMLRQSGDVDIWVEGERRKVVDFLRSRYPVRKIVYHHCDAGMLDDVSVEVHFTPSWMNAPCANRRLQRWFSLHADEQFSHFDAEAGFCIPTHRFDGVYLLLHIYRHLLDEGVGLRQFYDYYYLLSCLTDAEREAVVQDLRHLKLLRFAGSVMHVLGEVFAMDESRMLCPPASGGGAFLLDAVLRAGNFGRSDERNAHAPGEGLFAHGFRRMRRGFGLLFRYPGETIAMPFFMAWQYCWRRRNGYLYKGR